MDLYIQMRSAGGVAARTFGTLIAGSVKYMDWKILHQVLSLVEQDQCPLDKRELCVLKDIQRNWKAGTLHSGWLRSGFDESTCWTALT